jgi:hypothetical protein
MARTEDRNDRHCHQCGLRCLDGFLHGLPDDVAFGDLLVLADCIEAVYRKTLSGYRKPR